jgi:hypothetical protein
MTNNATSNWTDVFNSITALCAVVIAVLAYLDSRFQNRKLLSPALVFNKNYECNVDPFSIIIENCGYGSAIINSWKMIIGKKIIKYNDYKNNIEILKAFSDAIYELIMASTNLNDDSKKELFNKIALAQLLIIEPNHCIIPNDKKKVILTFSRLSLNRSEIICMYSVLKIINYEITYSALFGGKRITIDSYDKFKNIK